MVGGGGKRVKGELTSLLNLNRELFSIYYKYLHQKIFPLVRRTLNGICVKCIDLGYYFDPKTVKCDSSE